ncbi:DNA-methyltransferase [Streptantibioticus silvisoli]|uniref:Methyltransferase n=1 Tax=Streptantibioticus silvisoli TaxID=2705255 RepID=A0ABT6W5Y7_9ACTN|nr:DNA methyltransferase [Streptantibioticus silvisoli]MDI5965800.1 DNA methyltransferase [Streptantibioticus silvisoli]
MTTAEPLDLTLTPPPGGEILHQSDRATVVWGDCRDPAVIAACPRGYGLLLTDPPYGVRFNSGRSGTFSEITGDDGSVDWPTALGLWADRLAEGRHVYAFGYAADVLAAPLRLGGTAPLMWDKRLTGMGNLAQNWGPAHEPIAFGVHTRSAAGRARGDGRLAARLRHGSVLRHQRPNSRGASRHSNEKPIPLLMELIESSTRRADAEQPGDLVVDPCAGSGSTAVAAVLLGRRAHVVEIDRHYAEVAVERVRAAEKLARQIEAA